MRAGRGKEEDREREGGMGIVGDMGWFNIIPRFYIFSYI